MNPRTNPIRVSTLEGLEFEEPTIAEGNCDLDSEFGGPPPCCVDAVTGDWEPCEAHEREERERQDGGLDAHLALARSSHGGGW